MAAEIDRLGTRSGRTLKEDSTVANLADLLEALQKASAATRTFTHTTATMTTTSGAVLAANTSRKYAIIINDHATEVVYVKLGVAAVVSEGIRIAAGGGAYAMSETAGNLDNRVINGIVASGTAKLLVTEGV